MTVAPRRLLVVAGGTRATASTRHRLWSYRPYLERDGVSLTWLEYTGGRIESPPAAFAARARFVLALARNAGAREVVLVQKVLPPITLVRRWRRRGCRVVYDFEVIVHLTQVGCGCNVSGCDIRSGCLALARLVPGEPC